jgi:hypothetical protein
VERGLLRWLWLFFPDCPEPSASQTRMGLAVSTAPHPVQILGRSELRILAILIGLIMAIILFTGAFKTAIEMLTGH